MSYIKSAFVQRILKDEGDRLLKSQGGAIARKVKFHTYRIDKDRSVQVISGDEMDGKLRLVVPHYLRLLDIKRTIRSKKTNRASRRSMRIYNRFVFGHYFSIAKRLMNDFTDEVADSILKEYHKK